VSDEQKIELTAANVGQKIASTEVSIPLNIPITDQRPKTPPPRKEQESAEQEQPELSPPTADSALTASSSMPSEMGTSDSVPQDQLTQATHKLVPIAVEATPAEAKAATNPLIKLFVGAGAGIGAIGLIGLFIFNAITGICIIAIGVLVVVGGVLSPKPKS
jgi:predicted lipid-binding transport protein (Tim44 family)